MGNGKSEQNFPTGDTEFDACARELVLQNLYGRHTAKQAQSRRFLQSIDDNFLMQVVEEPTRKGTLLDLVLTKRRDWWRM